VLVVIALRWPWHCQRALNSLFHLRILRHPSLGASRGRATASGGMRRMARQAVLSNGARSVPTPRQSSTFACVIDVGGV